MSKKTYLGVSNIAHQVKKAYIGVNNVSRKVKKIYLGVAGIARQIFGGGEPTYIGSYSNISTQYSAGAVVNNHFIIAGGQISYSATDKAYAYSKDLTRTEITTITGVASKPWGASVGGSAFFGGGYYTSSSGSMYTQMCVSMYNSALTRTVVDNITGTGRYFNGIGGNTSAGNYAIIAGGRGGSYAYTMIDGYTSSGTKTASSYGLSSCDQYGCTSFQSRVFYAGGVNYTGSTKVASVCTVDASLTSSSLSDLSSACSYPIVAHTAKYIYVIGGSGRDSKVEVYDSSFTKLSTSYTFPDGRDNLGALSFDEFVIVGGSTSYSGIYYYDNSLTLRSNSDEWTVNMSLYKPLEFKDNGYFYGGGYKNIVAYTG